jgi:cytochrome c553
VNWLISLAVEVWDADALEAKSKTAKSLAITVMRLLNFRPKMLHMKKIFVFGLAVAAMTALSARADDAKAIYEKDCAKCHGADGKGQTKMGQKLGVKDYTDAKVQAELKDDAATKAIKEGLKDKEGKVLMKPAESLSDSDIKGLVAYIRTLKK